MIYIYIEKTTTKSLDPMQFTHSIVWCAACIIIEQTQLRDLVLNDRQHFHTIPPPNATAFLPYCDIWQYVLSYFRR